MGRLRRGHATRALLEALEPREFLSVSKLPALAAASARNILAHTNIAFVDRSNPKGWGHGGGGGKAIIPHSITPPASAFTATQIRRAYGMDQISFGNITGDGAGQTIAIIGAYHYANAFSDLQAFDAAMGLANPTFIHVAQDGTQNFPQTDPAGPGNSWALEAALDIQWSHAMAPKATIMLVEASDNSFTNMVGAAVNWARAQPNVSVVSMSFGAGEFFTESSFDTYFTTPAGHQGVTFIASTGDAGRPGGYPAYSPNVVAIGGTSLTLSGGNWSSESGWSGSGGGISSYQNKPSYQSSVTLSSTRRTTPDISLVADPNTGVAVYDSFDFAGSPWIQLGGTSLSAPLFAGMMAVVNQGRVLAGKATLDGRTETLPMLYNLPAADFHDVTTGNNGYAAGAGYDLVTGRGTPIANLLIRDLVGVTRSIAGTAFVDANRNGIKEAVEDGLPGVLVYLDENNNGIRDIGGSTTLNSGTVNLSITNNNTNGITSTLAVAGLSSSISDVNVTLSISHNNVGQLSGYLIAPDGTQVNLFYRIGGSGNNYTNTTFDDQAASAITSSSPAYTGTFRPSPGSLSAFNGMAANGNWKLKIIDHASPTTGTLLNWKLTVTTVTESALTTAAAGAILFANLTPGTRTIRATTPNGYETTTPTSYTYNVQGDITGADFGYALPLPPVNPPEFNVTAAHNAYYIWFDELSGNVRVSEGTSAGAIVYESSLAASPQIVFHLFDANALVIVDYAGGAPIPDAGLLIDGPGIPTAQLEFQGAGGTYTMTDDAIGGITYTHLGTLTIYQSSIFYSGTLDTLAYLNINNGTIFHWS